MPDQSKKSVQKPDCLVCSQLEALKIRTPDDLIACIDMIKDLIANGEFERISSNFELEHPKTPEGWWQDDLMYYSIRCRVCGQAYSCVCDTFHGSGRFGKGE